MATRALTSAGCVPQDEGAREAGHAKADRILAAAHALFLQHGFGETSMDAIARHAAVS